MSTGRIDLNANGIGTKQTVAKGDIRKQVKAFINSTCSVEQKKASIAEYLRKQKTITFSIVGNNVTIKTGGEYSTTYNYEIK